MLRTLVRLDVFWLPLVIVLSATITFVSVQASDAGEQTVLSITGTVLRVQKTSNGGVRYRPAGGLMMTARNVKSGDEFSATADSDGRYELIVTEESIYSVRVAELIRAVPSRAVVEVSSTNPNPEVDFLVKSGQFSQEAKKPKNVTAKANKSAVVIRWQASGKVDGFILTRKVEGGYSRVLTAVGKGKRSFSDREVISGSLEYAVFAFNQYGISQRSNIARTRRGSSTVLSVSHEVVSLSAPAGFSDLRDLTVQNNTSALVRFKVIPPAAPFEVISVDPVLELRPGASVRLPIRFQPTAARTERSDLLRIVPVGTHSAPIFIPIVGSNHTVPMDD